MKYAIYVFIVFLLLLAACQNRQQESKETGNKQKDTIKTEGNPTLVDKESNEVRSEAPDALTKTEQGYALPRFDDGMAQSPINILSSNTEKEGKHGITLKFNGEINAVENLGHTIQLDPSEGSAIIIDGVTCQFKQLHFHTPSEHLIDGVTYPMEMHVVNISKDQKDSGGPAYIVIGFLFKMGHENNFIKEFLNAIPGEENKKEDLRPGTVRLEDLFNGIPKNELETYYQYKGSLTTPPFTESVNWIIRKYIFEASAEQINAMEKIEGDNARHVQALYKRKVASN